MESYLFQFLLPLLSILTIAFIYTALKGSVATSSTTKDLHPFYTRADVHRATRFYIPTKFQNVDPSDYSEPRDSHAYAAKEKLIPFFLNKAFKEDTDDKRFYLVLGDAGMGKTTFLINLYVKYKRQFFGQRYDIRLLPMAYPDIDTYIKNIEEKENTILLLDGLDEDIKASQSIEKRIDELSQLTWKFREVVITCRTQFFPSAKEEPLFTNVQKYGGDKGYYKFSKMYGSAIFSMLLFLDCTHR
jgi:predicted NACHT family NTPase